MNDAHLLILEVRTQEANILEVGRAQVFEKSGIKSMDSVGETLKDIGGERRRCWKY
jgi:hypothetical protein